MLTITIPENEIWDEKIQEFVSLKEPVTIQLEHSLVSISKWESKWKKAYLSDEERTHEEIIDYVRCMTVTDNVDPLVYYFLTNKNISEISEYIKDPMTATTFTLNKKKPGSSRKRKITAELLYFKMISLGIPIEFENWHLNRLLTLIKVCDIESSPKQKMSKGEILRQNAAINKARRKKR